MNMNRLASFFLLFLIFSLSIADSFAECPLPLPDRPLPSDLRACFNEMGELRDHLQKVEKDIALLRQSIGGGRVLAMAVVEQGKLIRQSDDKISFDAGTGKLTFSNPGNLQFVPIVTSATDAPSPTDTHFVQIPFGADNFIVRSKVLDTGPRAGVGHDFSVVVVGFDKTPP
jgi:hypothetical protein